MIDYRMVLKSSIAAYFSRSNGDPKIHLASEPFLANNIFAFGFPKETPYIGLFERQLLWMQQSGRFTTINNPQK